MSLRTRVLAAVAVVAIVLAIVVTVMTRTTRASLIGQVDSQLTSAIGPVRSYGLDPRLGSGARGDAAARRLTSLYVGVLDRGAVRTLVAPNLSDVPLPDIKTDDVAHSARTGQAFTVGSHEGGSRYRALAYTDLRARAVLVLALPIDTVDAAVSRLVAVQLVGAAAILAALGLVAWWVMERDRVEARLRQFVADASHELRTPVATVRGYAELYRSGGLRESGELDDAMRRTEQESVRMGGLVDDLLQLARLDQKRPLDLAPVDLASLAEDAVNDARATALDRPITVRSNGPVVVEGDEARLRQVVANLIGNALVHTPTTSSIEVSTFGEGATGVFTVRDEGPGMAAEVVARAFERFYRADPARSRHQGGSGLGLAIVQAVVEAHRGRVSLESSTEKGTTVRVQVPLHGRGFPDDSPSVHGPVTGSTRTMGSKKAPDERT